MKVKAVVVALFLLAFAGSAMADYINIDFSTNGATDTGTISGNATSMTTTQSIAIGGVSGLPSPVNSGTIYPVTSGALTFTTGAYAGQTTMSGVTTYYWGPSSPGAIVLTGTGPGCATLGGCPPGTTTSGSPLLTGAITSATYSDHIITLVGTDTKDTLLTNFFGAPPDQTWDFQITIHMKDAAAAVFSNVKSIGSTDISNQFTTVPDGGMTLMLLGSVLAGLETLRRRLKV